MPKSLLRSILLSAALVYSLCSTDVHAQWLEFQDASATWLSTGVDSEEKDLVSADFNKDGLTDVVVVRKAPFSNQGGRADLLLMNTGTALEDQTAIYAPEFLTRLTDARDVVARDFDGDTWVDLVIASTFEDQPVYYANLGESGGNWQGFADQSTLRFPQPLNVNPLQFCALWAGDVSGNFAPDIYFSNYDPNGNSEDVLLINNGQGIFTDESNARLGNLRNSAFGTSAEIHDLDLDGDHDIIKISTLFSVPPFNQLGVFVLYNNGDGTFTNWQNLAIGEQPYMFTVGHIDDNAFQDIYIVDDQQDFYHLLDGSIPDMSVSYTTSNSTDPRTAAFGGNCKFEDLDGDGDLDFGIADVDVDIPPCNSGSSLRKFSLMQNEDGVLDPTYGSGVYPWNVSTYDFVFLDANGDFLMDFLLGVCDGYTLFLQVPECNAVFELAPSYEACEDDIVTVDAGPGYDLYDWSTGESTQSIDVLTGGTYCVTVTDIDGCTYVSCTEVNFQAQPFVGITGALAFCTGEATILEATGNGTFIWNTGATDNFIDVFTPGTYCVTITDVNGCTSDTCVEVTELDNPNPLIGSTGIICTGQTSLLSVSNNYASILWSTGETSNKLTVTSIGDYCVTVTDFNGCTGSSCIFINEIPAPVVNMGSDTIYYCAGTTVLLDAGLGFEQYEWSTGEVLVSSIEVGGFSDIVCVTVTDANDCTAEDCVELIQIPVDSVQVSGPDLVCRGESITVSADTGFVSYTWSTGEFGTAITISEGGSYCVKAVDSSGCESETCFEIAESEAVEPDLGADTVYVCSGSQVVLEPAFQPDYLFFAWSTGQTTSDIILDVEDGGIYCVTVTDVYGCTGDTCIFVDILPENITFVDAIVCNGDSINPDSLGAGIFVGTNGCDSIVEVAIMELPPITYENLVIMPDLGAGTGSIAFQAMGVPGGFSYLWDTGDTTASIQNLFRGQYSVTVTDLQGCVAIFTFTVPLGRDRPDLDPSDIITVHPNPFRSSFTLIGRSLGRQGDRFLVVDVLGDIVHTRQLPENDRVEIRLEAPPGVYFGYLMDGQEVRSVLRLINID